MPILGKEKKPSSFKELILEKLSKPINAKMQKKGSDYRPGTRVPAIEESLYTEDDLG